MKKFLPLFSILLISACGSTNYLHTSLKKVEWEMTPNEVLGVRPGLQFNKDDGFRLVYLEEEPHGDLLNHVYYFDIESNQEPRLYEVIMEFRSESLRDAYAAKLLGPTNTTDGEWRWTDAQGGSYMGWTYKQKLIVVKVIPGCEWDE